MIRERQAKAKQPSKFFQCSSIGCDVMLSRHPTPHNNGVRWESCDKCNNVRCLDCQCLVSKHNSFMNCQKLKALEIDRIVLTLQHRPYDEATGSCVVPCPQCWTPIEKLDDGTCNTMQCECGACFCILCGTVMVTPEEAKAISSNEASTIGHAHYEEALQETYDWYDAPWLNAVKDKQKPQCIGGMHLPMGQPLAGNVPRYSRPSREAVAAAVFPPV